MNITFEGGDAVAKPSLMRKKLFFKLGTDYTTSYTSGTTPFVRYYLRIYTDDGMLVPKNPSQLGYLVMTADRSKYNSQSFSDMNDAKAKMSKNDILIYVNNPRPVYVNFGFDINNGFNVYMGGQSTSVSNFYYQMIDTNTKAKISRIEIIWYDCLKPFAEITPKFKLDISNKADMSGATTIFNVNAGFNYLYSYDNV